MLIVIDISFVLDTESHMVKNGDNDVTKQQFQFSFEFSSQTPYTEINCKNTEDKEFHDW